MSFPPSPHHPQGQVTPPPSPRADNLAEVHIHEALAVLVQVSPAVVGRLGGRGGGGIYTGALHLLCLGCGGRHLGGFVILHGALLAHTAVLGLAHLGYHGDDLEDEDDDKWG